MALLTVSLDQVAILKTECRQGEPDTTQAAVMAELAGADGISIGLRRDRRHVTERDLYLLREIIKGRFSIVTPPGDELLKLVSEIKPTQVTLVADQPDPNAPVQGIDFDNASVDFSELVGELRALGVDVVFFIEPRVESVKGVSRTGATGLLIDCSVYTRARNSEEAQTGLDQIDAVAQAASKTQLSLSGTRAINYRNLSPLAELALFDEFVIGGSIAGRAMLVGLDRAIGDMKRLMQAGASATR